MDLQGEGCSSSSNSNDEPPNKKSKVSHLVSEVIGVYGCKEHEDTNYISMLPHEILVNIFKYLDFKTISSCATLCKSFYKASNDSTLYSNVTLKYTMEKGYLEAYTAKISHPKKLFVEYKFFDKRQQIEDYTEFNKYVTTVIKKYGQFLNFLHFESCRSEEVLQLLSECPNLTSLSFYRCKSSFEKLPTVQNLTRLRFVASDVPNTVLNETLKHNLNLRIISLFDNINLYVNGIAETIGEYNRNIEELYFCEKRRVRAKGMRALARCNKLKVLELTGGPYQCDPEDSLQQMAAGCSLLERLSIYGWKGINDDNLLPMLQCCTQLKELDLRGIDITIKSCREAALSLPKLQTLDVYKCNRIKKTQLLKLQRDFQEINIVTS
ncbi:hypothetical protein ILUMI_21851 [Ignelater luminosus]|uniref:F-box domain-containing protein n=1 Tax=Ignelater luminosus TaxID=2038154 RepID=A0A8K0CHZ2_IGNLU|nr:hypothetical protein ILUMI_21851 [Ignelater luminosus]